MKYSVWYICMQSKAQAGIAAMRIANWLFYSCQCVAAGITSRLGICLCAFPQLKSCSVTLQMKYNVWYICMQSKAQAGIAAVRIANWPFCSCQCVAAGITNRLGICVSAFPFVSEVMEVSKICLMSLFQDIGR